MMSPDSKEGLQETNTVDPAVVATVNAQMQMRQWQSVLPVVCWEITAAASCG
jgi:hypothetical protein